MCWSPELGIFCALSHGGSNTSEISTYTKQVAYGNGGDRSFGNVSGVLGMFSTIVAGSLTAGQHIFQILSPLLE